MKILKTLTNDYVLFSISFTVVFFIWFNYLNSNFSIFIEVIIVGVLYYFISLFTSIAVVFLIYLKIKNTFDKDKYLSIFHKLEIVTYIFSKYHDDINTTKDFQLKLEEVIK